jgi:hypothetical protein
MMKSLPSKTLPVSVLRSEPIFKLSYEAVYDMLKAKNFFDSEKNKTGTGLDNKFEPYGRKLVIDKATGLVWQESGPATAMTYADAEKYVFNLRSQHFAGFNNWRLPTLEEAMSLMKPDRKSGILYIHPIFDRGQSWIWTSDLANVGVVWVVYFSYGDCGIDIVKGTNFVRAVR